MLHRRPLRPLHLALAALTSIGAAVAQAVPPDLEAADRMLREQLAKRGVGLSAAIVSDGRVVFVRGYGVRQLGGEPVTADTRFPIGSVTKQLTSACVLLLAEDGALSLDDPVADYYPELTRARDITLLDLMTHTSGYRDYYPLDYIDARMATPIEPDALLQRYAGAELDFAPGTSWSYSNTGYVLLGRIVEKITGEPFGAFLQRRILTPLGMHDTVYEPEADGERLARGYISFALGPPEPAEREARGWIGAAGGIWSTAADLAKWDIALMSGALLERESLERMTRPRRLRDGRLTGYGCGLVVQTVSGRELWRHGGAVDGFVAENVMVPSTRSAVVVFANHAQGLGALAEQLTGLLQQEAETVPEVRGPDAKHALAQAFAGLQRGEIDRSLFTDDFNAFLGEARLAGAAARLRPFGQPERIDVLRKRERGGMEVTVSRLVFSKGELRAVMYRQPDGAIAQLFVSDE